MFRTQDGGEHWQQVTNLSPAQHAMAVAVGPPTPSGRTLLVAVRPTSGVPKDTYHVYRSADEGDTWHEVFGVPQQVAAPVLDLRLSPDMGTDSVVLITANGRLYHSVDAGVNWTDSTPWSDQVFGDIAFAPSAQAGSQRVASLIFATAVSSLVPSVMMDRRPRPTEDHIRSIGVVLSRDGGASWQPTRAQPELDGVPYRQIQSIVVSPTYAQDQGLVLMLRTSPSPASSTCRVMQSNNFTGVPDASWNGRSGTEVPAYTHAVAARRTPGTDRDW
ncbi:MAG: hypothetical protein IT306_29525 [Chloroflexi bacterium]|nr:hypothetical protein [Chloroflexota bacterium]